MGTPQLSRYFKTPDVNVRLFRTLGDVLRADDKLAQAVRTWQTWDGDQNDGLPPNRSQMPWVRLTPLEFDMAPASEHDDKGKFRVRVDIAVAGTCWDDLGNLAGAVRDALKWDRAYAASTVSQAFFDAGCNLYRVGRAGTGARRTEQPPSDPSAGSPPAVTDLIASAVVEFDVFYPNIE